MLSTPLNHLTDRELQNIAESQLDELTSRHTEIELLKRFGVLLDAHDAIEEQLDAADADISELIDASDELNGYVHFLAGFDIENLDRLKELFEHFTPYIGEDFAESIANNLKYAQQASLVDELV